MGVPTRTTNVSIWCKQHFPQLLEGKKNIYLPQQLDNDEKEIKPHVPRRIQVGCRGWNDVLVSARITFSSLRDHVGVTTVRPASIRPNGGSRSAGEGLCVLQSFLFTTQQEH